MPLPESSSLEGAIPPLDAFDGAVPDLPGIEPGMTPAAILDRLAKLREEGNLSGSEYQRARHELLAALGLGE